MRKQIIKNDVKQNVLKEACKMRKIINSNWKTSILTPKQAKAIGIHVKTEKYNRKKAKLNGITFDSTKERDYYAELLLLKHAGKIKKIELQPQFLLQPAFVNSQGKKERAIIYKADFKVTYSDGHIEIVDTKGFKMRDYRIKRKMLLFKYPNINFKEA